jgi:hypothetical protein
MATKQFSTGEVLTASDTNTFLANSGLVFVKSQTVGSGVSSVVVSSAFSTDYDNYRIIYSGGSNSTSALLGMQLGSQSSGYYTSYIYNAWNNTAPAAAGTTNDTSIQRFGRAGSSDITYGSGDLFSPFLTRNTRFVGQDMVTGDVGMFFSLIPNTTSFTAFTLVPSSGLLTGGTITVYGYRKG